MLVKAAAAKGTQPPAEARMLVKAAAAEGTWPPAEARMLLKAAAAAAEGTWKQFLKLDKNPLSLAAHLGK